MGLQLRLQPATRARIGSHGLAETPLVNSARVLLKYGRGDEWFEDEEAAEIHAIHTVYCPVPARV